MGNHTRGIAAMAQPQAWSRGKRKILGPSTLKMDGVNGIGNLL
jgi:hypothetical protein